MRAAMRFVRNGSRFVVGVIEEFEIDAFKVGAIIFIRGASAFEFAWEDGL